MLAYQPVFGPGDSLVRNVNEVPRIVAGLAQSFRDHRGERMLIENHWLYTGTGGDVLDQARFGRAIGVQLSQRDVLDRLVNVTDITVPALAFHPRTGSVGIQIVSIPNKIELSSPNDTSLFYANKSTFISNNNQLVLDRPLAQYLKPEFQRRLTQAFSTSLDKIKDHQIGQFILNHSEKAEMPYANRETRDLEKVIYLPDSVDIDMFATENSYHPTRDFYEQLKSNQYGDGDIFVDGHIHRALTPQRVGNDELLAALAKRYGPIKAARVLSLNDAFTITGMDDVIKDLEVRNLDSYGNRPGMQHAARELYVINDKGEVVDHSAFNIIDLWADQDKIDRFQAVVTEAKDNIGTEHEIETKIKYHDMMHDFTIQIGINEPLSRLCFA